MKLRLGGLIPADCVGREIDLSGHIPDDWRVSAGYHEKGRQAIVSALASTEEIAGMDVLCSDKTSTPTQNIMTIESKLQGCSVCTAGNRVLQCTIDCAGHVLHDDSDSDRPLCFPCVFVVLDCNSLHTELTSQRTRVGSSHPC